MFNFEISLNHHLSTMPTQRNYDANPVKILSLDGGGTWAILQAMALQDIYSGIEKIKTCGDILDQFDIIVANSGGSLILAALIENKDKDISTVINLFDSKENRGKLFSSLKFGERSLIEFILKFGTLAEFQNRVEFLSSW